MSPLGLLLTYLVALGYALLQPSLLSLLLVVFVVVDSFLVSVATSARPKQVSGPEGEADAAQAAPASTVTTEADVNGGSDSAAGGAKEQASDAPPTSLFGLPVIVPNTTWRAAMHLCVGRFASWLGARRFSVRAHHSAVCSA